MAHIEDTCREQAITRFEPQSGILSEMGIFRQPSGFHSLMALRDSLHPARRHIPKNGGLFIGVFFDADA